MRCNCRNNGPSAIPMQYQCSSGVAPAEHEDPFKTTGLRRSIRRRHRGSRLGTKPQTTGLRADPGRLPCRPPPGGPWGRPAPFPLKPGVDQLWGGPKSTEAGPTSTRKDRPWADFGQVRPNSPLSRSKLAYISPTSAKIGQSRVGVGRHRPEHGRVRARFGRPTHEPMSQACALENVGAFAPPASRWASPSPPPPPSLLWRRPAIARGKKRGTKGKDNLETYTACEQTAVPVVWPMVAPSCDAPRHKPAR